ncbi:threonine synthase [Geofilum rubicundum]|uniref:Threonine synthase n=1 Tax=Geofilum rubicundum JCM 15548 TaxID=1236989 RepID=A0A0E9LU23_9BACT|nr:threonine synthase [Geofilum rubicundum]GAO28798.1 threonine synthase [Geofilum rubicundum JCM 15548]
MKFISLGSKEERYTLKEVLFKGLAPDGSLFMPEAIPVLSEEFIENLPAYSLPEIAFHVLKPYVEADVSDEVLRQIVEDTFSFEIPLKSIEKGIAALELYHGPTQAFKDVGARFLSRLLAHFNKNESRKLMVLTATSGDTGGAVAHGFHKVKGIEVVVLYPNGKVSPYQEYQITSPGANVHAMAVEGSFDDCQRLVKEAFKDNGLRELVYMTSANSINMGRLLPQMVYYFHAVAQLKRSGISEPPVITVPSGNFGNITAAMLAHRMGLPVKRFVAATNVNDVVPRFLSTGAYDPHETIVTLANAMDVGDPSNFPRMYELYNNQLEKLKGNLSSFAVNDDIIKETIKAVYQEHNYLMDPHTASAYYAVKRELKENETGLFVSTAHPFKFGEIIDVLIPGGLKASGYSIDFPRLDRATIDVMPNDYGALRHRIEKMA